MASRKFYFYRYQLLPDNITPSLCYSKDDLIKNKNKIFYDIIFNINSFIDNKTHYKFEIDKNDEESILLIFNKQKKVKVIRKDHTKESIVSYPFGHIFIDNNPLRQIVAIQEASDLSAITILNSLKRYLVRRLRDKGIIFEISPLYEENNFWNYVDKNKTHISHLVFNIITPNMSNISSRLNEELKQTAKDTGTAETSLCFAAPRDGYLNLDRENKTINDLIDYTSKGGGNIIVKIKGVKIGFNSNDHKKSIDIDEITFKEDIEDYKELIRSICDDGDNR